MSIEIISLMLAAGGVLVSAGVAWGTMKGGMSKYMTHEQHEIKCHEHIDKLTEAVNKLNREIGDVLGYVRGRMEGK